jgi:hypothetical protein
LNQGVELGFAHSDFALIRLTTDNRIGPAVIPNADDRLGLCRGIAWSGHRLKASSTCTTVVRVRVMRVAAEYGRTLLPHSQR